MIESKVERLAEDVLKAHELDQLPVDPFRLADLEGISLVPGNFQGSFQARIEYRRNDCDDNNEADGCFYLLHPEFPGPRPTARLRFSLAHELGHFYIPDHRRYLITGQWRGQRKHLVAARRLEREADWFAAALLMPREAFARCARRTGSDPLAIADFSNVARSIFHTSLLATALRTCNSISILVPSSFRMPVGFASRSHPTR